MSAGGLLVAGLVLCFSVEVDCHVFPQSELPSPEKVLSVSDVPDTTAWSMFFLKVATFERDDPAFCRSWLMRLLASEEVWHGKFEPQIVETIIRVSQEQVDLMERYSDLSKQTRASLRASYTKASKDTLDEVQIGFSSGIADEMLVFSECMRLKSALMKVFGPRGAETWARLFDHVRQGKADIKVLGMGEDQKRELREVNAVLPWGLSFRVFPDVR